MSKNKISIGVDIAFDEADPPVINRLVKVATGLSQFCETDFVFDKSHVADVTALLESLEAIFRRARASQK